MQEFMANAAQQYGDQEKLPDFREEDIEMAINEATTPEEQFAQIERKYGIPRDVMERMEQTFVGVTHEALMPSKNPTEYQKALQQLLDLVEETLILNQTTMPYEHPRLPSKLPLRVASIIYPDFEPSKIEKATEADIMAEIKKIAIYNTPDAMKERAKKQQNLANFFDEEERRINDPEYSAKKRIEEQATFEKALKEFRAEKPDDVVTSVKGDVQSLLKSVPVKGAEQEEIDLTDDIEVVYEDAPPTVKEGRRSA